MRYEINFKLDSGVPFSLGANCLPEARGIAERMTHKDDKYAWWDVVDTYTDNVVMSSDSVRERKGK